jgi:hypothetical protein
MSKIRRRIFSYNHLPSVPNAMALTSALRSPQALPPREVPRSFETNDHVRKTYPAYPVYLRPKLSQGFSISLKLCSAAADKRRKSNSNFITPEVSASICRTTHSFLGKNTYMENQLPSLQISPSQG